MPTRRRIPTHTHKATSCSPHSKGVYAKSAADVLQAYCMSFTFEMFQLLKSPLKARALANMDLGGGGERTGERG